ncbi:Uncharacterised protein [Vibrio cholerae]|nr:Uncharacterised protein [Vibrio cholerae]CSB31556.1 Uncharacterised protein [Vibrio cholerae]CSB78800.1 Uncharacterised protein [Vibrio cholerae]CSC04439.1 Uncharacterised protein [Vibrio cholerae]
MIRIARRSKSTREIMRTPAAAIVPNITIVAPPSTGSGINCTKLATPGNKPSSTNMPAIK